MEQLSIEERLAKFRKEKTKTNPLLDSTTTLSRRFVAFRNTILPPKPLDENSMSTIPLEDDEENVVSELKAEPPTNVTLSRALFILKIILWLILWGFFVEIGFGAVYFIASAFIFICKNTNTGSKKKTGPSAYSVFNPDCERLDGTFTAEQFEKELRYGSGSVK
ncbi:Hypothetical predicted protein [Octopus vulgaris]|uniref:SAYSvFN domain-containing protein n=1 Tax=Octopus vulgaris TaxID=6645 RepID=A0AA36ASK7_OCTVU|nr:Hypothetical predicted protein [Octopus vulgaris]